MRTLTTAILIIVASLAMSAQTQKVTDIARELIEVEPALIDNHLRANGIEYFIHGSSKTETDISIIVNDVSYLIEVKARYSYKVSEIVVYFEHDNVDHVRELMTLSSTSADVINPGKYRSEYRYQNY